MQLLLISFLAGMLTVITPCVLPILPVILGGSLAGTERFRPLIISLSLVVSIFAFTFLLKVGTLFTDIPQDFWTYFSGGVVGLFGLALFFPSSWSALSQKLGFERSNELLQSASQAGGYKGQILLGMALGPVFASCSPTFAVILVVVLPQSLQMGVPALLMYLLGLSLPLLLIGYGGRSVLSGFRFFANPTGTFRRGLGALLIVVGVLIVTGYEKKLEIALLNNGLYDFTKIDQRLVEGLNFRDPLTPLQGGITQNNPPLARGLGGQLAKAQIKKKLKPATTSDDKALAEVKAMLQVNVPAPELVDPQNWINSKPLTLKSLKGKVVVLDFWTYSCINCIRSLPALKALHEKYASQGLVILGVHTPEFAFEKKIENVKKAVEEFGLKYPIFQDNDYKTWNAYSNNYWPAKYIIDRAGNVRYTHFGEGEYENTEKVIKYLLTEGKSVEREVDFSVVQEAMQGIATAETYLGTARRANFAATTAPSGLQRNQWTLGGSWRADAEKVVSQDEETSVALRYTAGQANLVMGFEEKPVAVSVWLDGKDTGKTFTVAEYKLYQLAKHSSAQEHLVELKFKGRGVELYAYTFG